MNETNITKRLSEIQRGLKVNKDKYNSFANYYYRDAEMILESVKELLKDDEIIICDSNIINISDRFYVEIVATFKSGDSEIKVKAHAREDNEKKGMDSAQLTGACISYAKKYALCNLFAIDNEEDDIDSKDNTEKKQQTKPNNIGLTGFLSDLVDKKFTINEKENKKFVFLRNQEFEIKSGQFGLYVLFDKTYINFKEDSIDGISNGAKYKLGNLK